MSEFAWAVLSFFLGLWLGHRLQLGRDRRAELNAAAVPVRAWVARQKAMHEPLAPPDVAELDAFISRLSPREADRFREQLAHLVDGYLAATRVDDAGQPIYHGNRKVGPALDELDRLTRPR